MAKILVKKVQRERVSGTGRGLILHIPYGALSADTNCFSHFKPRKKTTRRGRECGVEGQRRRAKSREGKEREKKKGDDYRTPHLRSQGSADGSGGMGGRASTEGVRKQPFAAEKIKSEILQKTHTNKEPIRGMNEMSLVPSREWKKDGERIRHSESVLPRREKRV